jgi:hypothetical protein
MNCLFCPISAIECHDFDNIDHDVTNGFSFGACCKICETYYDYHYENNERVLNYYALKTRYNNKNYLLLIKDQIAILRTVTTGGSGTFASVKGKINTLCEFPKPPNITPFNFKDKLPVMLLFI